MAHIEFLALTHARAPYSSPALMVVHFESEELEKMSMTLKNLVEMMNPTCFEEFFVGTQAWLLYSFVSLIFLQLVVQEKEDMKQNRRMNIIEIVDNVVENLTRRR